MSDRVDALFSGNLPEPNANHEARLQRLNQTAWAAIALNILGIPCWTSVPGAALTLWVWFATDPDSIDGVDDAAPPAIREQFDQIRRRANVALTLCIAALLVQIILLSTSFYERLWGAAGALVRQLWQSG